MTKAVIFDLDSCLAAAAEAGASIYDAAFAAIERANCGSHTREQLDAAFTDLWRLPFDFAAAKHRFTTEMRLSGWESFRSAEATQPMRGYGDLDVLKSLAQTLFLVTSGFRKLQESKVRALGIEALFAEIHIDAIDEPNPRGKQRIFADILSRHSLEPHEVVIVGDNAESELAAGERMGIKTIQTLRPDVPRSSRATHHIQDLTELAALL